MTADINLSIHCFQNENRVYKQNFFRILTDDFPEQKYQPKKRDDNRTTVHYGQRKLMLSEIEFLTNVCNELPRKTLDKIVLIYAGAAPGIHIDLLSKMFPFVYFVLIDPAKFLIEQTDRIKIKQEYFTDEMALELKNEYDGSIRLFISDIRLAGPGLGLDEDVIEKQVLNDMRHQENWYYFLKPFRSLLKFRLPYIENRLSNSNNKKIQYLNGDIYFQIWAPNSSSETRLYVRESATKKEYDCVKYENQMYRFNNIERANCYEHTVIANGIDHCYDCRTEVFIFQEYLKCLNKIEFLSKMASPIEPSYSNLNKSAENLIFELNKHLNASNKLIRLIYDKQEYEVRFTDIKYGINVETICNRLTLAKSNSFGLKWNRHNKNIDFNRHSNLHVKNRLTYPIKRLQHQPELYRKNYPK